MGSDDYVSPLGLDVGTLESSFNLLAPQGEELVRRFYNELFKRAPTVIPMFDNTTPAEQQTKLLDSLKLVIDNVRNPQALAPALTELGVKHQEYGALPEHYPVVASALIDTMKQMAGEAWTDTIESAWKQAL
jgi:methyl-accepting chemotaxis protein